MADREFVLSFLVHPSVVASPLAALDVDTLGVVVRAAPQLRVVCRGLRHWWRAACARRQFAFRHVHESLRVINAQRGLCDGVHYLKVPKYRPSGAAASPERFECPACDADGFFFVYALTSDQCMFHHLQNKRLPRLSFDASDPPLGANPNGKVWDGLSGGWISACTPYYPYIPQRGFLDTTSSVARAALVHDLGIFQFSSWHELDEHLRSGRQALRRVRELPDDYFYAVSKTQ